MIPGRTRADRRDLILASAYERNAKICQQRGHHYLPDLALNGDYACGYCRAAKALTEFRPDLDKVIEVVG